MKSLLNRTEYILLSIFKDLPNNSKTARLEMGSQERCTIHYAFISIENTFPPRPPPNRPLVYFSDAHLRHYI